MLRKIQPGAERLGGIAEQRGKTEEDVDEYQKLADEELIQKLREGDERIMDYILEKYKPLVLRKANAMFLIGGDTDDLIQEGMIGLFKAIRDYRSDREASFSICGAVHQSTALQRGGGVQPEKTCPLEHVCVFLFPDHGGREISGGDASHRPDGRSGTAGD